MQFSLALFSALNQGADRMANSVQKLGAFLRAKREAMGYSLRDVERLVGVPNAQISVLENGGRTHLPTPEVLFRLGRLYSVSMSEMLTRAGYLKERELEETEEQRITRKFQLVVNDRRFKFGTRLSDDPDLPTKRLIVEMYEKLSGATLDGKEEIGG